MTSHNPIGDAAVPFFDQAGIRYEQVDENTVCTGFHDGDFGHELDLRYYSRASVLVLRFQFGARLRAIAELPQLAELALAINEREFFLKLGRDPRQGELVADVELPLFGAPLSPASFGAFFISTSERVMRAASRLAKVRWGGATIEKALGNDDPGDDESTEPEPTDPSDQAALTPATTPLERQIVDFLASLPDDRETARDG